MKNQLKSFGIQINLWNIKELAKLNPLDVNKVSNIKEELANFNIKITEGNIASLSQVSVEELKKLGAHKGIITADNILLARKLIENLDLSKIKAFLQRKHQYLEKNRTLSQESFEKLFKVEKKIDNSKGNNSLTKTEKYGFKEIKQTGLGYCFAYTGFNLLQKSNFFETLIQTSMREVPEGREVKVPFGDKNGRKIKVSEQELTKVYDDIPFEEKNKDTGKMEIKYQKAFATSDSSIGIKILEIAFIKQYVLEYDNIRGKRKAYNQDTKETYHHAIENAKKEFDKKGDFTLTGSMLGAIQGGISSEWMGHMLGINKIVSSLIYDSNQKEELFLVINNGLTKIEIGCRQEKKIKTIDEKNFTLYSGHAYTLERTYLDKNTGEKVAVVTNPWNTSEKILMKRKDCVEVFDDRNVMHIDPNKLFTD